jgi:hypothetical protein
VAPIASITLAPALKVVYHRANTPRLPATASSAAVSDPNQKALA